jgi:hypothetical protein
MGVWNGLTVFFGLIGHLFDNSIRIYAFPNSGGWYDFGFFLGACIFWRRRRFCGFALGRRLGGRLNLRQVLISHESPQPGTPFLASSARNGKHYSQHRRSSMFACTTRTDGAPILHRSF